MLRVGLTGGIGTGKTTVARIFQALGIPVYYADQETKRLMNESPAIRAAVTEHFGAESYQNGTLNRSYIASQVFNDPVRLQLLNSLTHPATIEHANEWIKQFDPLKVPFTMKEAALLFESGSARHLDFIIGVSAPLAMRLQRVRDRDGLEVQEIRHRIDRQLDETIKMKLCDAIIVNDEQQPLIPQVLRLFEKLSASAATSALPAQL